ncbi:MULTISPECIES: recombination regulator RecX [Halobacillus]|uniref:Regulatory protein RecX n=1 Tax=Halobacillus halophilus (strain ATCC 35676 / DSM 2266 / JCM 20832 / KCTC 3685 / LMG 17431 / NBRC 102448 / NCIMB 2269) TaxID=866895 RepID=I0JJT4_HALH3|nr:recombination regulator RecX [Halobacillus halophilus]ASF38554.1 recombination regulator RecX [Halobacillus halophilus]CCG44403.1 recombination regulator RecX [Halobacillus halophilus DSM 2266]
MAKLTKITTQKKNKGRYNIFLDYGQGEAYGFSVSEDILIQYHLQKNMELDESTIQAMIQTDTIHKSYTLAINYLSYRMRSEKEIRDYLDEKEVDEEHIDEIVSRLYKEKLLDDQEFANSLVRTRVLTSSKGPLLVKKELIEKGVQASQADAALEHYPFDDQYSKAMKFAEKKLKSDKKKSARQQIQNVQQTLMQKGFSGDVVKEVLSDLPEEESEDEQWEAVVYQGEKLLRKFAHKAEGYELKQKIKTGLYRKGFSFDLIERFLDEYVEE